MLCGHSFKFHESFTPIELAYLTGRLEALDVCSVLKSPSILDGEQAPKCIVRHDWTQGRSSYSFGCSGLARDYANVDTKKFIGICLFGKLKKGTELNLSCQTPGCYHPDHIVISPKHPRTGPTFNTPRAFSKAQAQEYILANRQLIKRQLAEHISTPMIEGSSLPSGDKCKLWEGRAKPSGFGNVKIRGYSIQTNMLAWALEHGEFTSLNHVILNTCGNRRCMQPRHLEKVSRKGLVLMHGRRECGIASSADEVGGLEE